MKKITLLIALFCIIQITIINANTLEIKPIASVNYNISDQSYVSLSSTTESTEQAFVFNYKNKIKNVDITLDSIFSTNIIYVMFFNLNTTNSVITEINNFLADNQNAGYNLHNGNTRYTLNPNSNITKIKFNNSQSKFQFTTNESINEPYVLLFLQKTPDKVTISYATFYNLDLLEQKTVLNCEMNNKIILFFCNENNQNCNNLRKNCLLTWTLDTSQINLEYNYIEPQTITKTFNYVLITRNAAQQCNIEDYPIEQDSLNYRCVCVRSNKQNYYGVEKCFNGSTVVYGPYNKMWNPTNHNYIYLGEYPGNLNTSCWKGATIGCNTTMTWSTQVPVETPSVPVSAPVTNTPVIPSSTIQTPAVIKYYTTTFTSGTTGDVGKCADAGLQSGVFGCVCRPGAQTVYAATCTNNQISLYSVAACQSNTTCKTTAASCYSKPLTDCR